MGGIEPKTILVADGSENDVALLSWALEHDGISFRLDVVIDGEQAMEYLSAKPTPCLILLELKLAKHDGFEVLQWLRTQPNRPAVVIWSASNRPQERERAHDLGAEFYFVKPLSTKDYAPLIEKLHDLCSAEIATS